ncbi:MAG TPA: translocase [Anaeromyxobacter sp.]|nr:translocase [Anaeromyxobacter sp.]
MTDLVVALFVAILVVAGLYVPRWGDAVGRRLRGDAPDAGGAPPREGSKDGPEA